MTIGIIGPAWPLRGGLADFDERLARELQRGGHGVTIYSYSLQYPSFLFPGKSQYTSDPAPADLKIETCINSVNPLSWLRVGRRIRKAAPDLLIVRYWLPFMGPALGTMLRSIKKNKHTKVVVIADNISPHEKRPGDAAFTKYFIKPADAFVTMSEEVLGDVRKLTPKPALRLHHPLYDTYGEAIPREDALKRLKLPADKKYLLFFGFIRKYKGLDLLLEAMPLIKDERIRLIVAGEYYGDKELYEGIIAKHGLQSRVHLFTDFIPNDEVGIYFSACDAVALPYRSATQSGITQVAYHFEKGMIATDVGGLPEAVKDGVTGIICKPEPAAIAAAVPQFFEGDNEARFAAAARGLKQELSWAAFVERLLGFAAGELPHSA